VGSFSDRLRDELLSSASFATPVEARLSVDQWRLHYNHRRIQRALGKLTPAAFTATSLEEPSRRLTAAPPGMAGVASMDQIS